MGFSAKKFMILTNEQRNFIDHACAGENILVDACIGSGKTTAIQYLCNVLPKDKSILYLTYNKLLKLDAKEKIKNRNVLVQNYHGFAWMMLDRVGVHTGQSDLIQAFLRRKPPVPRTDVLILDEYQDIEEEIARELLCIKAANPGIQIIAVGDMAQKIYDKTRLDIARFIVQFLDDPTRIEFTHCFRLPKEYAAWLGRIWGKKIIGTNKHCKVSTMTLEGAVNYLAQQKPSDIICLGAKSNGDRVELQNRLETEYGEKFNKKTVWSSIDDKGLGCAVKPSKETAIFTTFDGSKGMERPICVLCDYDSDYWRIRSYQPHQRYDILRNIFLVGASRGKRQIIFVKKEKKKILDEKTLGTSFEPSHKYVLPVNMSSAFDFNLKEDVEKCYETIKTKKIETVDNHVIQTSMKDGLIDLSPCIGEYVEASYFEHYDIDSQLKFVSKFSKTSGLTYEGEDADLQKKILYLTYRDTNQIRYRDQAKCPFIEKKTIDEISRRMGEHFTGNEQQQTDCEIKFAESSNAPASLYLEGRADVIKDDIVWELKFVKDLSHEMFLQLACYIVALRKEKGMLWNIRDNTLYEVTVPDRKKFLDATAVSITKGSYKRYYKPYNPHDAVVEKGLGKAV